MSKILVIDDELSILTLCKDVLSDYHHVLLAAEGKTGLALIEKEKPDLLILDLKLPGESGLDLLPKIKALRPGMPVIIFSGHLNPEIESQAFKAGAADIIAKGRPGSELKAKVDLTLKRQAKTYPQKTEKILVVDDEETIRSFLVTFLESKGFQTLQAQNGREAIEIVKKEKPTLMLLDLMMPGMNGIETLREIRKFDKDLGVVMATAIQDETIAQEAAELGSYQYVTKPFDLKYLELVVLTRLLMA